MSGEDHGGHFVAELFLRERLSGLGIARVDHQFEQVARRRALGLPAARRSAISMSTNFVQRLRKRARAKSCGLGQLSGKHHVEEFGPRHIAIFGHIIAQRGAVTIHAEREHGASGDFQRHALHRLAQIHRCVARGLQFGDRLVGGRYHMRDQRRDGARREGRRQRSALMLPGAAFGNQQAIADDRPQHAHGKPGAGIVLVIVDQHMLDRVRRVDDEAAATEEAAATISSS